MAFGRVRDFSWNCGLGYGDERRELLWEGSALCKCWQSLVSVLPEVLGTSVASGRAGQTSYVLIRKLNDDNEVLSVSSKFHFLGCISSSDTLFMDVS